MRLILTGMSGVGKSTLASTLLTSLNRNEENYKYLSIDNYRLLYSDGSIEGENKAYDIFLNDCQMYTHSVIECTGLSVHFNTLIAQSNRKYFDPVNPFEKFVNKDGSIAQKAQEYAKDYVLSLLNKNPYAAENLRNLVFYCFCDDIERQDRLRERDKQDIPFPKEYTNIEEYSTSKFVPAINQELNMAESVKDNVLWIKQYINVYNDLYNLEDKHYAKR